MGTEPSPRWGHFSALVEKKLLVWGGHTKDFLEEKSELPPSVYSFSPIFEFWVENRCSGVPPPGLYIGACAAAGQHLYVYGGNNGSRLQSSPGYHIMDMEAAVQYWANEEVWVWDGHI